MYWPCVFAALFGILAAVYAWHSYSPSYSVSMSFFSSRYEFDQNGNAQAIYSFNELIDRANTYSQLVKNSQVRDAVRKAVDFNMSKQEYERAVSAQVSDNNAAVVITVSWYDAEGAYEIAEALKAYLSHVITSSADVGMVRWVDGYSTEVTDKTMARDKLSQLFFLGGFLFGACAGIGLAIISAAFDRRVFELEYVDYGHPIRVLGVICRYNRKKQTKPMLRSRRLSRFMRWWDRDEVPANQSIKQLIYLAGHLLRHRNMVNAKTIIITSPMPAYGKSTIANGMAMILADNHQKVLTITLQKPRHAGIDENAFEVVENSEFLHQCLYYVNEEAGILSKKMFENISRKSSSYDFVLIDCPAILYDLEFSLLVSEADETIIVYKYGKTTKNEVLVSVMKLVERAPGT
jgi:capsular polysaccharide biosynthesis protein